MKLIKPNLYDYLKVIAIITMIIDHVWYYFFPEIIILRFIWRLSFPLFLFLVGFSNSYKRRRDIFSWWMLIQILAIIAFFKYWIDYPTLNILLWIVISRGVISIYKRYLSNTLFLRFITIISIVINPLMYNFIDYGMLPILFVIFWYLVKNKNKFASIYWIIPMTLLLLQNILVFKFDVRLGLISVVILTIMFISMMILFISIWKNNITLRTKPFVDNIILFISKKAIHIYIIHIIMFSIIYAVLNLI